MKRFANTIISLLCGFASVFAAGPKDETLEFKVTYKWGVVNKQAGTARLTTKVDPATKDFVGTLTARSDPWADKFFSVRDTMRGRFDGTTLLPSYYEKISNEGGRYEHDVLRYERDGDKVKGDVSHIVRRKGQTEHTLYTYTHEAVGPTLDMLGAYYYMRYLDFAHMKPNTKIRLNLFSGSDNERLTIRYMGTDPVELDGKRYVAYRVAFSFTSEGQKKSSENIEAWISATPQRIPLKIEGKLPVGKVRCLYVGEVK